MSFLDQILSVFGRGDRLNVRERFELLRSAVTGTMSNFYMARDRQSGQIVGLKVLDKKKRDLFEARFKGLKKPSEGEIASQFKHDNIVETFEYGWTTEGEHYLIMEFIEGPGLQWVIAEQPELLDGIRLPLIRQIAEGLNAVHKAGFIHRDVCPRNVMVEPISGVLKLIDFGLTIPNKPEYLRPGNRTGNPNFMAPEILKRQQTDQRVDVFAFGITAFELCTLKFPWKRGKDDKAAVVAMQRTTAPPADLLKIRPQVNQRLAKAIASCLECERDRRCPSIEDFLQRIRDVEHEDE